MSFRVKSVYYLYQTLKVLAGIWLLSWLFLMCYLGIILFKWVVFKQFIVAYLIIIGYIFSGVGVFFLVPKLILTLYGNICLNLERYLEKEGYIKRRVVAIEVYDDLFNKAKDDYEIELRQRDIVVVGDFVKPDLLFPKTIKVRRLLLKNPRLRVVEIKRTAVEILKVDLRTYKYLNNSFMFKDIMEIRYLEKEKHYDVDENMLIVNGVVSEGSW